MMMMKSSSKKSSSSRRSKKYPHYSHYRRDSTTHKDITEDGEEDLVAINDDDSDTRSLSDEDPPEELSEDQIQSNKLAEKETVAVFRLRLLVFIVLFLAAVCVSLIVYFITSNSELDEYRNQYDGAAKKILESFMDIAGSKLGAVSSMGVAIIAHGVDHDRFWPFVTLSSFQQRSSTARKQSGSLYIHINPFVTDLQKDEWDQFVIDPGEDSYWINEGLEYQETVGLFDFAKGSLDHLNNNETTQIKPIWYHDSNEVKVLEHEESTGPYMPTWQTSPVFQNGNTVNENILKSSNSGGQDAFQSFLTGSVVLGRFLFAAKGDISSQDVRTAMFSLLLSTTEQRHVEYQGDPVSQIFLPIFDSFRDDRKPVAVMVAWIHWMSYFQRILPSSLKGIYIVLNDSCGGEYTYVINGEKARPIGNGDLHDGRFNSMKQSASFESVQNIADGTKTGLPLRKDQCTVSIDVYPSEVFYDTYNTKTPIIMTVSVSIIFVFTALMFVFYDRLVERRQALVMTKALQTNAIVSSLFPANVRDRLMEASSSKSKSKYKESEKEGGFAGPHRRLKGYLQGQAEDEVDAAPIADLFPHCTVLFADISGFTAWSSTRDPAQVFILLQTVYQAFDKVAKRRKVFKVETIGDSYLAVTGLPEPQPNHAIIMVRFAHDCLRRMYQVTSDLEVTLGPDTAELSMRFGLHSGPVTAGVLRGERARFQLFGDTVNTASRMESTGVRGKIQVSRATAGLVTEANKQHWLIQREQGVQAKGKGTMQTFWIDPTIKKGSNSPSINSGSEESSRGVSLHQEIVIRPQTVNNRLIEWVVDLLMDDIKKIVYVRRQCGVRESTYPIVYRPPSGNTCMDEVKTVIEMERFDSKKASCTETEWRNVFINQQVVDQLREYVTCISSLYHDNPFHSFEHACHVTLSVKKLLKRIVSPELSSKDLKDLKKRPDNLASHLHDCTHGLTSDPIASLAIVFSALIHDVDHKGVSNAQLQKESPELAQKYDNKSIAEQNSLDLSWDIFMRDQFCELRRCLFSTKKELMRFRQLIVNVVLATDIFDKELNDLRKMRWERAFSGDKSDENINDSDLRATIVIEHIIQASDVSHTMQHWHVYQKWNRCLFREMHLAYRTGRMAKDPATFWYKGEIGFFDNYVIPLAKKLKECGVFGVSSDEYLNYALQNRAEWADRGEDLVKEMIASLPIEEEDLTDLDSTGVAAKESTNSSDSGQPPLEEEKKEGGS